MNLELSDEQRELRDTVRRFLAEEDRADRWRGLSDLGATGILIPEEYGGSGLTMSDAVVIAEETGAALLSEPWLSSAVAAPRAVLRFGAEAEAADLLAGIADGTTVATVATGESLMAEFTGVADAAAADVILVAVPQDGGAALYRVDAADASITPEPGIDPTRNTFRVTLGSAPARLLATAESDATAAVVDDVFVAAAADALGAAQRLVDSAVEYAKTRTQFGQPIGGFQSVAHMCVDMFETVELTRSGVLHAGWAADESDVLERHLAAWRLKAFAARLAAVGDTAIQVFGGIGFTWEHDAHRHLKRLLSWNSLLGGSDRYLEEVGALFVRSVVEEV